MRFVSGLPETRCGRGSTLEVTEHLRAELPKLLQDLEIKRLLDAPCGDLNWITRTDLSGLEEYVGIDVSEEMLEHGANREFEPEEFSPKLYEFALVDLVSEPVPSADAVLCRDFLQHLPAETVLAVLRNFASHDVTWLIATSHEVGENTDIDRPGDFRRLNLLESPFSFPEPERVIQDPPGSGRILGAWRFDTLGEALA
ncbi:class I SAM-dependent methyltransferase [Microbaculum marinum]|uniref:Class I SAM-dependent methyltransferase n=1 Tax=Microbaculum marinum TaxID=1764581 RepID=A0AAW9RG74_9HYPH